MAGQTTVSALDALLDEMQQGIQDMVALPDDNPELMILGKVNSEDVYGRSLTANVQFKTMDPGAIALMTEGSGEFPTPLEEQGYRGSTAIRKIGITFGWTPEAEVAAGKGRPGLVQTVADGIKGGMKRFKQQQVAFWYGRGDGVVFRCEGAQTGDISVLNVSSGVPILAVEGDFLTAFKQSGSDGDERGMASTDATSASFLGHGSHARRVTQIDPENNKVYFDGRVGCSDDAVACIRGTSSTNKTYPMGLQGHVDDVSDASFKWDADDNATYDKVDTYMALARSTAAYRKLNALTYNVNGAISISALRTISALGCAQGVKPNEQIMIMHPKMFKRIQDLFMGALVLTPSLSVQFPGGKMDLPVMTVGGLVQMPVIVTYRVRDGVIVCLSRNKNDWTHYTDGRGVEWVTQGNSRVLLKPGSTEFTHQYRSYAVVRWETACLRPFRQVVGYGITMS